MSARPAAAEAPSEGLLARLEVQPLHGSTRPRLYSRPLRRLTPATSLGFQVIAFAVSIGVLLLPWQQWLLIHALELRPDGRLRFKTVVVLVSRQNGKTTLLKVLALWKMHQARRRMVVGTSTNLEYAREAWLGSVQMLLDLDEQADAHKQGRGGRRYLHPVDTDQESLELDLAGVGPSDPDRPRVASVKYGALDTSLTLTNGSRYKVATANRTGGRSLSVDLGIADELREHDTWLAWAALSGATTARPMSQVWALSNQGDEKAVVLNHFRGLVVDQERDELLEVPASDTLGFFEWSAPQGSELTSRPAWQQANPGLGYQVIADDGQVLFELLESTLAAYANDYTPELFRVEHLCQKIDQEDPAVSKAGWKAGEDRSATMDDHRKGGNRVVGFVAGSEDLEHITLVAAGHLADDRDRLEVVKAWPDPEERSDDLVTAAEQFEADMPDLYKRMRLRALGWIPNGPMAGVKVHMSRYRKAEALKGEDVPAVWMEFCQRVKSGRVLHPADPLLTTHVLGATQVPALDGGARLRRKGVGGADAAEAAAGAVRLSREKLTQRVKSGLTIQT